MFTNPQKDKVFAIIFLMMGTKKNSYICHPVKRRKTTTNNPFNNFFKLVELWHLKEL